MFAISKINSKFQKTTRDFQRFPEISKDFQRLPQISKDYQTFVHWFPSVVYPSIYSIYCCMVYILF